MSAVAEDRNMQHEKQRKPFIPKGFVLRCVAFPDGRGQYAAECIDLDIMVSGPTLDDALESLKQAVHGYLCVAYEGELDGLVPRPAPLGHRARYHWYLLRALMAVGLRRNFLLSDCSPKFC